ncbi:MAG: hypothetical protein ING25_11030 [Burkholderiales bacterium]|nr:hypothetical protein [Burkholderiales bacterium]
MAIPKLQLLSRTQYDTDGTSTVWDFNFSGGYILPEHVKAYYDSPEGVRTVVNGTLIGAYQLQITPAIPANNVLTIYRATPKDSPMVDFVDRGQVSEVALDTVARQAIFVAAEASDDTVTANSDVAVNAAAQALVSKEAAAASAVAAAGSASAAGGVLTSFRATWLGSATIDPVVDDNGAALVAGAVYLNTTANVLRVYDGANWQTSYAPSTLFVAQTGLTGAMAVPAGTTAQRPASPVFGQQRANSTNTAMEWWNGTAWAPIGVAAGAITTSGLTQATNRLLGRSTAGTGAVEELATGSALELVTGTLNVKAAGITASMLSGGQGGNAPVFGIRAWCTFDGTLTGTNAPLAGGGVISVTRISAGSYVINFSTAPNTNYGVLALVAINGSGKLVLSETNSSRTVSSVGVTTSVGGGSTAVVDGNIITVGIIY